MKFVVSTRETILSTGEILSHFSEYGIRSGFQYVGTETNLNIAVYGSRDCDAPGFKSATAIDVNWVTLNEVFFMRHMMSELVLVVVNRYRYVGVKFFIVINKCFSLLSSKEETRSC